MSFVKLMFLSHCCDIPLIIEKYNILRVYVINLLKYKIMALIMKLIMAHKTIYEKKNLLVSFQFRANIKKQ